MTQVDYIKNNFCLFYKNNQGHYCFEDNGLNYYGFYVYFLLKGNNIVYIGQTKSICSRISNHQKDKDFNSIYVLSVLTKTNALQQEAEWLDRVGKTKYNKVYPTIFKSSKQFKAKRPPIVGPSLSSLLTRIPIQSISNSSAFKPMDVLDETKENPRAQIDVLENHIKTLKDEIEWMKIHTKKNKIINDSLVSLNNLMHF